MESLGELIKTLKSKAEVDGAFLTGSHGLGSVHASSDIDLIIILQTNTPYIRSVYEMIGGVFSDIFFFDTHELLALLQKKEVEGNKFDGMLLSWLKKGDIKFDKSGLLQQLKNKLPQIKLTLSHHDTILCLDKVSYNFIANKRYFSSTDPIYREALAIRLMYSVPDLLTAFHTLRDEPWRGEKNAIKFIKQTEPKLYELFVKYQDVTSIEDKMNLYSEMVKLVIPTGMALFDYENPLALSKHINTQEEIEKLQIFWDKISMP